MSRPRESRDRSLGMISSSVLVALIAIAGVVLVVSNLTGRNKPATASTVAATTATTAAPASSASPSASASVSGEPSLCGLTAVLLEGTVVTAPEAEWALIGTTAAPSVAGQGPGVVARDGLRTCYARTPTGAVVMAANFFAMSTKPTLLGGLAASSVAAGPGREALTAQATAGGTSSGGTRVQIAGFRLLDYTGQTSSVDLGFRTSNGAVGSQVYDLIWEGGDWKVRLAADGALLQVPAQLPDLVGYTPWGGA